MTDPTPTPALRASDADRERAADILRRAAGDGRLEVQELDERLTAAYAARTRDELSALTADLQPHEPSRAVRPAGSAGFSVRRGEGGASWLVAILGGCDRKGRWRLGRRCVSLNVMGGSDLDLNQVELADDHVELTVYSLMGGADIRVPHGLRVEVTEFALLGGNDVDIGEEEPPPDAPVLHLRLFSLMGGTDVKRGPKLSRAERKALRRTHAVELGWRHPWSAAPPPPPPPPPDPPDLPRPPSR